MYDIVYVSYNSSKWINKCFSSWLHINYDLKKINIIVVDNCSTDDTIRLLKDFKEKEGDKFASFEIIEEKKNWGFGKANNIGFAKGNSDVVCFLNIDTELFEDTFEELDNEVANAEPNVGIWEFRQFPYEHPKMYEILNGSTYWSSGAAFAAKRSVYAEMNGFDEQIFMYAEDVDLGWRVRIAGYIVKYVPKVKITHYSYESAGVVKPNAHVYGVINNLLLRYRYGTREQIREGHKMFWKLMAYPEAFPGSKKQLLKQYIKMFKRIPHFKANDKYREAGKGIVLFAGWDYCYTRDGAYYENFLPEEQPLVSIIVRTCGRISVLRETMLSLRRQTYKNIEIVIVEDGDSYSEYMLQVEFSDLNIIYHATKEKVGRSKAGNIAMSMAHGKYLNFLDDDDLFYADHVEVLVANILKSGMRAAYATAFETPIIVESKEPYIYHVQNYLGVHKQPFDRMMLFHHNYIPIQCIMFEKSLFEEYGGLDESVDALEDWDMWVRYAMHTDFAFVLKTTSMYRVPAIREDNEKRQRSLDDALVVMREKHKGYTQTLSVYDFAKMFESK